MKTAVIVDGVRTPFAKAGEKLKRVPAYELGRVATANLLDRMNLPVDTVDEVVFGNTGNPSEAANITRVIALQSGFPQKISAYTVHRNCASALEAVTQAALKISAGETQVMVAGGAESMSQMPVLFSQGLQDTLEKWMKARSLGERMKILTSLKMADLKPRIGIMEGLTDPFCGLNMGQTAEKLAREFGITREEQDAFAIASHEKTLAAQKKGVLAEETTPVYVPPGYADVVNTDIGPREGLTMEKMAKLKPFFDRAHGSVTVGNSCPITDGAVALALMEEERAKSEGRKPLARVVSYAWAGLEPERMGLGPVYATYNALKKANLKLSDMDRVELNEAFASQVLACQKAFASEKFAKEKLGASQAVGELRHEVLNVNGGAIALGHPVGATGARLVLTLAKELVRSKKRYGLATLCIGGGQGGAIIIENMRL